MKSILDWENVKENDGSSSQLPAGGYLCQIMDVIHREDKEYLKINLEIIEGEYRGRFTEMAKRYDKWPCQMYRSYKEKAAGFFKHFICTVERTNQPYKWDWNERGLVGKQLCVIFREEEYISKDGTVKIFVKPYSFCNIDDFRKKTFKIPACKKLEEQPTYDYDYNDGDDLGPAFPAEASGLEDVPF